MKRFVLIDGNAILHRAYHALPPLTNKQGDLTNAVYGFFSMLLKIINEIKPLYFAVCFDRPKPTFRQTLYAGYQAHRPKMDEELVRQIKMVHKVLAEAKIPIFEIDGYEADDLIGTLAVQALRAEVGNKNFLVHDAKKIRGSTHIAKPTSVHSENFVPSPRVSGLEVIIVSGDRDMLQLVNSRVKVLAPVTGITNMILYDGQKVEEKYSIKPAQMVDYKALVGDPSDNYPGVLGVGPKTAADLLKQYGSLENIYQSLDEIKKKNPRPALKLAQGAEAAGLAKKLATIVKNAPVTLDLKKCNMDYFNKENLIKEFEKLGFKSLVKRVENGGNLVSEVQNKEVKKEKQQLELL